MWGRKKQHKKNSESEEEGDITIHGNHIYFYSDVSTKPILQLNKAINELNEHGNRYSEIWIHINSYGGTVYDALAAVDTIKASPTPIVTLIEGMCASAATMLSVVGDRRYIRPHSVMLIHQLRCGVYGKQDDVADEMDNVKKLEKRLVDLYVANSKLSKPVFQKMMGRELEYSAKKCLKMGFVDKIYEGEKLLGKRKR
jgi:ATP-dependent Clp protease protease subunit